MQIANIPAKWYVPFAANDSARVEIPVTTSDATRASQSLGFPPPTMLPPESGGVPPQGEDFNGAMNQIARIAWWLMAGGPFAYDSTFATNSNINGYPQGAQIEAADGLGTWISAADNNQINPDTVGTNWVPGYSYGSLSLTGQTGGTTTLTPAQAIKSRIAITGTLTSALTIVVPNWIRDWTVLNGTTGAFSVTVKTAAGSGVAIPQNSQPTLVHGDGTNVTQAPTNIAAATQAANPVTLGQFPASLTGNGYQKLPNGLILQWGTGSISGTSGTGTFPIAFPTACFVMTGNDTGAGTHILAFTPTSSAFTVTANAAVTNYQWFAVGI